MNNINNNIKEIWTDIEGFENFYQKSNLNRVKRKKGYRCRRDKILKAIKCGDHANLYGLHVNGVRTNYIIHLPTDSIVSLPGEIWKDIDNLMQSFESKNECNKIK